MNIHSYEKLWLVVSMLLIIGFISTVVYGATAVGIQMVNDDGGTIDSTALEDDERFADPRVERVGENEYAAYVVARQFIFEPDPIEVPANSTVTFYVTSPDVIHGFEVVGTNANAMVIPGEVTELTVEVNEPREYGILCNEYCGGGHHGMEGKLVVVPEDEFGEEEGESEERESESEGEETDG